MQKSNMINSMLNSNIIKIKCEVQSVQKILQKMLTIAIYKTLEPASAPCKKVVMLLLSTHLKI